MKKRKTPSIFFVDFRMNVLFYKMANLNRYGNIAAWPIKRCHHENVVTQID